MPKTVIFSTQSQSMVFEIEECDIYWRYWGPKIEECDIPNESIHEQRPSASFSPNKDFPLSIAPLFGNGWFNSPSISLDRSDKNSLNSFSKAAFSSTDSKLEFHLEDEIAKIRLIITFEKCAKDVIAVSTQIINLGFDALRINQCASATLRLPNWVNSVTYYTGRHNSEFVERCDTLSDSIWLRENRRGLTSHDNLPAALVHSNCGPDDGAVFGAILAHSGNSTQRIEKLDGGDYLWLIGEFLMPSEIVLNENESFETPKTLISFSENGTNGISNNFYDAMRNSINWPGQKMSPRPIHLNTWEGFYFDHKEDELFELAEVAARIGVERFVLDDGWFKGRNDDTTSLGDWIVDTAKYPNGLQPLAQHVLGLGMDFGLWVEPEMVNPDSDLFRKHPEWILFDNQRSEILSRNQLVLNLTKPEVRDYLFNSIDDVLKQLPVSYLKWDHNRDLTQASDENGLPLYSKQIKAFYDLISRIRQAHPNVEIEACAGGGGRIDPGILRYSHRFWTSDCIDALSRINIQSGFLQFFPPEIMGAHIGAAPSHSTSRTQDIDFRSAVALQGHFGLEFDLRKISNFEIDRVKAACDLYKNIRGIIHKGKVWRGKTDDGIVFTAIGNLEEFVLYVYRLTPCIKRFPAPLKLGFIKNGNYRFDQIFPHEVTSSHAISASWLRNEGLFVPLIKAEQALIFKAKRNG